MRDGNAVSCLHKENSVLNAGVSERYAFDQ